MKNIHRKLNITAPPDRDGVCIFITEYEWDDDRVESGVCRVLTHDGWLEYNPGEVHDLADIPFISGMDMVRQRMVDDDILQLQENLESLLIKHQIIPTPQEQVKFAEVMAREDDGDWGGNYGVPS